jgi:hypothetical protein
MRLLNKYPKTGALLAVVLSVFFIYVGSIMATPKDNQETWEISK